MSIDFDIVFEQVTSLEVPYNIPGLSDAYFVSDEEREGFPGKLYYVCREFAMICHKNQKDRGGAPYSEHLLHVSDSVNSVHEKTVAILHDIIEDTDLTHNQLFELLMSLAGGDQEQNVVAHVLCDVDLLTKVGGESYLEYLDRVKTSLTAINVKCADLDHNSDLTRLRKVTDKDRLRKNKYQVAKNYLVSYKQLLQSSF